MPFKPKPGQTNYTNIRWAPVLNCVLKHKDKLLLIQRDEKANFYPGYWSGVSGFLDDHKSLTAKVEEELREELDLDKSQIKTVRLGEIFDQEAPKYGKTWIVHPVLVEVKTDRIKLDWENKNYRWLTVPEIKKFKLLPGFTDVLRRLVKINQIRKNRLPA